MEGVTLEGQGRETAAMLSLLFWSGGAVGLKKTKKKRPALPLAYFLKYEFARNGIGTSVLSYKINFLYSPLIKKASIKYKDSFDPFLWKTNYFNRRRPFFFFFYLQLQ